MQRHQREANLPNFLSVQDIKTLYRIALFRAVYPTDVFREKWHLYVLLEEEFVYGKQVTAVFSNTYFYLFVPLDIFQEIQHNKNIKIEGRLEAWLTFLCMAEPEAIIAVIEKYPDFRAMYEQIYDICKNIEEVMGGACPDCRT